MIGELSIADCPALDTNSLEEYGCMVSYARRNSFRCLGYVGFAGDRTPHGMGCAADFAGVLAAYLNIPLECMGQPAEPRDVPWDMALNLSETFFKHVSQRLHALLSAKTRPILVTPRCATSIATLPIVNQYFPNVVVLWLDAHGDLNTPDTSPSGYLGGMPLAAGLGLWDSGYGAGLSINRVIHIGGRDWDESELEFIDVGGIETLTT
ncbi:MAG: arginase family protein, partial [Synechococcus sp.]